MSFPLRFLPLAFLGCGRIAQNIIEAYLRHSNMQGKNLLASGRNPQKTKRICEKFKIQMASDNEELLEKGSVIFICVKPQDMEEALQNLSAHWRPDHTVFSLAAGISFKHLKKWGLNCKRLVRLMPNTAVSVGEGFLPFCPLKGSEALNSSIEELLKPLGFVLPLAEEELLAPATAAGASGLAFVLELMQYWLEWLEGEGFSHEAARAFTVQIFSGAGALGREKIKKSFSDLQKEITSPQGVSQAGLKSLRELELERVLRLAFEQARLKTREIGERESF